METWTQGFNREWELTFDVDLARAGCSQAFAVVGLAAEQRWLAESCRENTALFPAYLKTILIPPAPHLQTLRVSFLSLFFTSLRGTFAESARG